MYVTNLYRLLTSEKDLKPFYRLSSEAANRHVTPDHLVTKDWCWAAMIYEDVIDRHSAAEDFNFLVDLVEEFEVNNVRRAKRTNKVL